MHEHGPNCREGPIRGSRAWWRGLAPQDPQAESSNKDIAESSTEKKQSGIRWELVERIRAEIAAGTYDTPQKWNAALERLLDRMDKD